jgi:NADH:ubiquinone oxidoreductase subunit 6 (subunit J)
MNESKGYLKIAQSASALGAGILGFGLGSKWGYTITAYAFIVIIVGAILHVWGMYVMQMRKDERRANAAARVVWVTAWICLIALVFIIAYLLIWK